MGSKHRTVPSKVTNKKKRRAAAKVLAKAPIKAIRLAASGGGGRSQAQAVAAIGAARKSSSASRIFKVPSQDRFGKKSFSSSGTKDATEDSMDNDAQSDLSEEDLDNLKEFAGGDGAVGFHFLAGISEESLSKKDVANLTMKRNRRSASPSDGSSTADSDNFLSESDAESDDSLGEEGASHVNLVHQSVEEVSNEDEMDGASEEDEADSSTSTSPPREVVDNVVETEGEKLPANSIIGVDSTRVTNPSSHYTHAPDILLAPDPGTNSEPLPGAKRKRGTTLERREDEAGVSDDEEGIAAYEKKPRLQVDWSKQQLATLPIKTADGRIIYQARPDSKAQEGVSASFLTGIPAVPVGRQDNPDNNKHTIPNGDESHITKDKIGNDISLFRDEISLKEHLSRVARRIIEDPEANVPLKPLLKFLSTPASKKQDFRQSFVIVSVLAIFIDIIPGYRIRVRTDVEKGSAGQKQQVSKDVRNLWNFEESLMENYTTFLNACDRLLKGECFLLATFEVVQMLGALVKTRKLHLPAGVVQLLSKIPLQEHSNVIEDHSRDSAVMQKSKKHKNNHATRQAEKLRKISKEIDEQLKEAEATVDAKQKQQLQTKTLEIVFATYLRILKVWTEQQDRGNVHWGFGVSGKHVISEVLAGTGNLLQKTAVNPIRSWAEKTTQGISQVEPKQFDSGLLKISVDAAKAAMQLLKDSSDTLNIDVAEYAHVLYAAVTAVEWLYNRSDQSNQSLLFSILSALELLLTSANQCLDQANMTHQSSEMSRLATAVQQAEQEQVRDTQIATQTAWIDALQVQVEILLSLQLLSRDSAPLVPGAIPPACPNLLCTFDDVPLDSFSTNPGSSDAASVPSGTLCTANLARDINTAAVEVPIHWDVPSTSDTTLLGGPQIGESLTFAEIMDQLPQYLWSLPALCIHYQAQIPAVALGGLQQPHLLP
ncbi:hypothetical protein HDU93_000635 [Gonapodya sp. JEL0774]|nr:hypothetical protein HDU93_000635 [Gonapodya sp. JEL0774]